MSQNSEFTEPKEKRTIVVLGSGPKIGSNVAALFASRGFTHVALLSRSGERLKEDSSFVQETAIKARAKHIAVKTYPIDLQAEADKVRAVLKEVQKDFGPPEVVLYNASKLEKSAMFEYSEKSMDESYRVSVVSLYTTASWCLPLMAQLVKDDPSRKPTLLVTSGGLSFNPRPTHFALAASKAAQHNLTMAFAAEYGPKGVHCAAVVVAGIVGPGNGVFDPANIAETYWRLYEEKNLQEKSVWIKDPGDPEGKAYQSRLT